MTLLRRVTIDPALAEAGDASRIAFLGGKPLSLAFNRPVTILVGENGCGKTTLLEAMAASCGMRPGGGRTYSQTEDERAATALSPAVSAEWAGGKPRPGLFLRADRLTEAADAYNGRIRVAGTGEWRQADEQSRGETMLSLLTVALDASEAGLFLLDEPEAALSPQRQMALVCLLDNIAQDGRAQVVLATHSPLVMALPGADLVWLDQNGAERRALSDIPHWQMIRRLTADPAIFMSRLLD